MSVQTLTQHDVNFGRRVAGPNPKVSFPGWTPRVRVRSLGLRFQSLPSGNPVRDGPQLGSGSLKRKDCRGSSKTGWERVASQAQPAVDGHPAVQPDSFCRLKSTVAGHAPRWTERATAAPTLSAARADARRACPLAFGSASIAIAFASGPASAAPVPIPELAGCQSENG